MIETESLPRVERRRLHLGNSRRPLWGLVLLAVMTLVFFKASHLFLKSYTRESTDDAFTDSHIVNIGSKLAGYVSAVHVAENQTVQTGDLLVEIDLREFQTRLEQKTAATQSAEANLKTVEASFALVEARVKGALATARQAEADMQASQAAAERARADFKRAQELRSNNVISPQEFDLASTGAKTAEAVLNAGREKLAAEEAKVQESKAQAEAARNLIAVAKSQLNQAQWDFQAAKLDIGYSRLTAPQAGRVTRKSVEPGSYVQAGQSLMTIVSPNIWVAANFKESQLQLIRPGQPVEIELDAYPARKYRGHVDSIQMGSGARFSLLPPENAVGNFVKVVQRVPVKILFDEPLEAGLVAGPGLSVTPSVLVRPIHVSAILLWAAAFALSAVLLWAGSTILRRFRQRE